MNLALARPAVLAVFFALSACGGGGGGGGGSSEPANRPPVANAGADQSVTKGASVSLDASGSSDPEGSAISYRWTQTAGTAVALSSATSSRPTFAAPKSSGTLTFSLVVSDGRADSGAATVSIVVANRAPVANAGADRAAEAGVTVTLDGSASTDPDGDSLTYTWQQVSGPSAPLQAAGAGRVSFVAASVGTYELSLRVSDGEATSAEDRVLVTVTAPTPVNKPPVVSVTPPQQVPKRSAVLLQGFAGDPDGDRLTYQWQQTAGPPVPLDPAGLGRVTFPAPPAEGDLEFTFSASDGKATTTATTVVQVRNVAPGIANVVLSPATPRTNDDVTVAATTYDGDSDPLTVTYAWRVNGTEVPGQTTNALPAALQKKGDVVVAVVTADDGTRKTSAEATTTIADTPAVLAAVPPTTATYGVELTFRVTATDVDGDPTPAPEVRYGPAGFGVAPDGLVTWRPAGPLFDSVVDVNWSIGLQGQPAAQLAGTIAVTDANRALPLRRTGIEIPVLHNGLYVGDLDGNGAQDLLVASNRTVYQLAKSGSEYVQTWVQPFAVGAEATGSATLGAVTARDIGTDGKQEIYFGAGDTVVMLDGATRREFARRKVSAGNDQAVRFLEVADVDLDGSPELVCLASSGPSANPPSVLVVMDARTLAVKWSTSGEFGDSAAVGNVDADPALEIVTSRGFVYDGATRANQWAYGPGFGFVDTGDLDGDGVEEIVGGVDWIAVRVYSAVAKSPLYELTTSDIDTLRVGDIDGDGRAEVLVGDGQWGNVTAYRYSPTAPRLAQVWALNSQDHGVTSIAVGDVDGDGQREFVWGSGATSSGADRFVVAGLNPTIAVEWINSNPQQMDGPFVGARLARVGGGERRLLFQVPKTNSGYDGARIVGLDPVTGATSVSSEIGSNWSRNAGLDVGDYDGDGVDEAFLATASLYDGYFSVYDFGRDLQEWTSARPLGDALAVVAADVSRDGYPDLVGITARGVVYAYDVRQQTLLWQSTTLDGGRDVAVADLDGDGRPEIVALTGTRVVAFRTSGPPADYLESASFTVADGGDLVVDDVQGDARPEVVVMSATWSVGARITVLGSGFDRMAEFPLTGFASALGVEPSASGPRNLLVAFGNDGFYSSTGIPPFVAAVDSRNGAIVWRSPALPGWVESNSITVGDLARNGSTQIALGTGAGMIVTR